jgi:Pyruvate/2-oxoacid:ferredoxin oxidoreductase gamma subunit
VEKLRIAVVGVGATGSVLAAALLANILIQFLSAENLNWVKR